jgi:hypothetical protein
MERMRVDNLMGSIEYYDDAYVHEMIQTLEIRCTDRHKSRLNG